MVQLNNLYKKRKTAFTIVEMLTVITIMVLLIAASITGWRNFVQNNQAVTIASQLTSALKLARASAIQSGYTVIFCAVAAPNGTACITNTTAWDAWQMFTDQNANSTYESANDILLRSFYNLPAGTVVASAAGNVSFNPSGFSNSKVFIIKPAGCVGNNGRSVTISPNGNIQTDVISCP